MEYRIQRLGQVESTNLLVKQAIDQGAPEGLVIRADTQSGGYGRQGRQWSSPPGSLYQSMLLRPQVPPIQLPTLGLAVAVAMRRALALLLPGCDDDFQVKWPNDVMARGRKLVGISCEAHGGAVCVGTGVNVLRPERAQPIGGKNEPAYLQDMVEPRRAVPGLVDEVSAEFLDAFRRHYDQWLQWGFAALADDYRRHHWLQGAFVQLRVPDGPLMAAGTVQGVDDDGHLLVQGEDGIRPFASGEVHIARLSGPGQP